MSGDSGTPSRDPRASAHGQPLDGYPGGGGEDMVASPRSSRSRTVLWIAIAAIVLLGIVIAIAIASRGGGGGGGGY